MSAVPEIDSFRNVGGNSLRYSFFFVLFPRFKCSLFHSIRFASHVADYFNGLLMSSTNFTFDYLPFFS